MVPKVFSERFRLSFPNWVRNQKISNGTILHDFRYEEFVKLHPDYKSTKKNLWRKYKWYKSRVNQPADPTLETSADPETPGVKSEPPSSTDDSIPKPGGAVVKKSEDDKENCSYLGEKNRTGSTTSQPYGQQSDQGATPGTQPLSPFFSMDLLLTKNSCISKMQAQPTPPSRWKRSEKTSSILSRLF